MEKKSPVKTRGLDMQNSVNVQDPVRAASPWLERNRMAAMIMAYVLTALYVSPIILFTFSLLSTGGFKESHWALTWFAAFSSNHESTLSEFHQLLLPVMAAVSAATFRDAGPMPLVALISTILALFFLTVALSVFFDIPSTQASIEAAENNFSADDIRSFFSRIREMLLTFVMMLLGIQVANTNAK